MPARSSLVLGLSCFPWAFSGMALHLGVQWSDQVSWAGLGADLDSEGEPLVIAGDEGAHGCDLLLLCLSPSLHGRHPGPGLEACAGCSLDRPSHQSDKFIPVPDSVVNSWLPAKQQIHPVELFAGPVAMDTWVAQLSSRNMIHFVDNSAALGCIVRGCSSTEDLVKIACDYWLRAASRKMCIYTDRVESDSNFSADTYRLNEHGIMEKIGAVFDEPNLQYLNGPGPSRDACQWFGGSDRLQAISARLRTAPSPLWVKASYNNAINLQKSTHQNSSATRGQ